MAWNFLRFGVLVASVLIASGAGAQEGELASVKPSQSGGGTSGAGVQNGRWTGSNLSLKSYIQMAYGVSDFQIAGPDWIGLERYDISAKVADGGDDQTGPMLQAILADRFKLLIHRDSRAVGIFELRVAASGLKVRETPGSVTALTDGGPGRLTARGASMAHFAEVLSRETSFPIVDRTRLRGLYDFKLEWKPGEASPASVIQAIQEQLGLRVDPNRVQIGVLVVDNAERVPPQN